MPMSPKKPKKPEKPRNLLIPATGIVPRVERNPMNPSAETLSRVMVAFDVKLIPERVSMRRMYGDLVVVGITRGRPAIVSTSVLTWLACW